MQCKLYLRNGVVIIPTTGVVMRGYLRIVEPVSVVQISAVEDIRRTLRATIARGNPPAPPYTPGSNPRPLVLKYAGAKSWAAFAREAKGWRIEEEKGIYGIVEYKQHAKGYLVEDHERKIEFPAGTPVEDVIERMIVILQQAAAGERTR